MSDLYGELLSDFIVQALNSRVLFKFSQDNWPDSDVAMISQGYCLFRIDWKTMTALFNGKAYQWCVGQSKSGKSYLQHNEK